MTIKDRLRDNYKWRHDQEQVVGVCDEAVCEIEYLERENAELTEKLERWRKGDNTITRSHYTAEIAKARSDALEEAAQVVIGRGYDIGGAVDPSRTAAAIRALKEKKP